ncbi:hypothetical protein ACFQ1E_08600 [Sphingomonas canadensis]|uniref:DUF306 domain-containing protein n=1 Tax=Sphingomonas canadensis TaxID=1219257 RepID=A0ABW3H4L6_9SPHN|nr:hypothetical protein [Sphingomonas canadensis]MCW3836098.1 hypothetical protein [Sphingomonas canadensis]
MFKYLIPAVALVFATPAAAQSDGVAELVATVAEGMQSMVGSEFEGGLTITQIGAEGEILVIGVGGPSGWRAGLDADDVSDALLSGFCKEGADFFTSGAKLRVESEDDGRTLVGPVVTACP